MNAEWWKICGESPSTNFNSETEYIINREILSKLTVGKPENTP